MTTPKTPLRQARERRNKTLAEVAAAVGLDTGNLSRIERDEQTPSLEVAANLAAFYGHEISEIQILYPKRYMPAPTSAEPRNEAA